MSKEVKEIKGIKSSSRFHFGLMTIIIAIIMLILPIAFLYLLNQKTGNGFGLTQILFSIAVATIATGFLVWLKSFMRTRPYFGLIIGLLSLLAFEYGLFQQFRGPNTTTFGIIIAIVVLIYLGIFFFKYVSQRNQPEGEIDSTK